MGISYRKAKKLALGIEISQAETKKSQEDAAAEGEGNFLATELAGDGEESDEGESSVNVEYSLDAEADEATDAT